MNIQWKSRNGGPFDWAATWAIAVTTAVCLVFFAPRAGADPLLDALERARHELADMPGNCLYVAGLAKRELLQTDPENSYRLVVIKTSTLGVSTDHAILCDQSDRCGDNGYISRHPFPLAWARDWER